MPSDQIPSQLPAGVEPLFPLSELKGYQRIIIYPAASGAEFFYDFLEATGQKSLMGRIVGFGDRDPAKQEKPVKGRPVLAPQDLPSLKPDLILVASIQSYGSIVTTLRGIFHDHVDIRRTDCILEFVEHESRSSVLATTHRPHLSREETLQRIAPFGPWYNQMPFGHGVFTKSSKGIITYRWLDWVQLPKDLTGKSVLDIGAWEGFYSFECAARGARDVLAVDGPAWRNGDLPRFEASRDIFNLPVRHQVSDLEDLSPTKDGIFDITLCFALFYNLKDPFLGMRILSSMTRESMLLISQVTDYPMTDDKCYKGEVPYLVFRPGNESAENQAPACWWRPNRECLVQVLLSSGFTSVDVLHYNIPAGQIQGGIAVRANK